MKRLVGLCMFWLGVGMAVSLLSPVNLKNVFFTFLFIILGYYLFAC